MNNRFEELRRASWSLPDGKQKLAVMEEMIRLADLYRPVSDAYEVRMNYVSAAPDGGCAERMMIAFAWCLAEFRKHPDQYSSFSLLWNYKWVLNQIWRIPEFSRETADRVFEDFKAMCTEFGYNLRPYHQQRVSYLLSLGELDEAADAYRLWRATPRDSLADCRACEQNLFGEYRFRIGHLKQGMKTLKPIMDGRMRCHAIPQNTYSLVMNPHLQLGETDQAIAVSRKAFRELEGPAYLEEYGELLETLTLMDLARAYKLYERTLPFVRESRIGWNNLNYLYAAGLFVEEWTKSKRRKKLPMADQVTPEWISDELGRLIQAFDRRNGNSIISERMADRVKTFHKLKRKLAKGSV
ncbi:hypothetical protein [Gorillibacterium sp. CAU 1737]|uniref:hypothetical protein n=1 Tax=Gorillibacterium sp. CAU 1737 TaxID=3140362 RepID=UPI0032614D1E